MNTKENLNKPIDNFDISIVEECEELDDFELKRFSFNSYKIERSIRDILAWITRDKIEVPKFQRNNVWTFNQSARFIESILLGLPTPDLFMYRKIVKGEEKFLLIDGFQRITTIQQFSNGFFENNDVSPKKFKIGFRNSVWSGKSYDNLDDDDKEFFNDYSLKISVFDSIDKNDIVTENNLMTSIFERINTGSTTLTTQEIRHAVYFGQAVQKLQEISKDSKFSNMIKKDKSKAPTRRSDEEFYLRLLTYYYSYKQKLLNLNSFDNKNRMKFYSSKKIMLNNFLSFLNSMEGNGLELLEDLSKKINDVLSKLYDKYNDAFYAYSLLRNQTYDKIYEPFAEALTIVSLEKGIPRCDKDSFFNVKKEIWIKFDETKETTKVYKEFFENTTSLDNVLLRVETLRTLLYSVN